MRGKWLVNSRELATQLVSVFAFIWYPFSHLYNYHIYLGTISGIPGILRLSTVIAILGVGGIFLGRYVWRLRRPAAMVTGVFGLFIAISASWVAAHFIIEGGAVGSLDLFVTHSMLLSEYLFLFLVGFYLDPTRGRFFFALGLFVIIYNTWSFLSLERLMLDVWNVENEGRTSYLLLSNTALVTGLVVWSGLKRSIWRCVVLVVMVPLLFALVSRAGLGTFLLVLPVALSLTIRPRWQVGAYLFGAGVVATIIGVVGFEVIAASRHLNLLTPSQDTSAVVRGQLWDRGIEQIVSSPILGYYGGTLAELGSVGSYIHNLFSIWQMFGAVPFLLYFGLVVSAVVVAVRFLFRHGRALSRRGQFFVVLTLIATVNVLGAKSYMWSEVALTWGLLAGLLQRGDYMSEGY